MADLETLEELDSFAATRNAIRWMANKAGEWAGIPLPIEGEDLVVEKSYRFAEALTTTKDATDFKPRNQFWSFRRRCDVVVWDEDGRPVWGAIPGHNHFAMDLHTLGCSPAWGIEQESKAIHLLGGLLKHHSFKQYMLTGMFLERSKRSGVMYVFRRLKPTVALSPRGESTRVLCTLCMHPIAYYSGTWAGAMCPTDDVIAHLMLMRGDEKMFWRRSNQHPPYRPESGL